jgi:hypothetical protein
METSTTSDITLLEAKKASSFSFKFSEYNFYFIGYTTGNKRLYVC